MPLQVTATRIDGLYKLKIKKKLKFSTKKLAKNEKKMTKKWSKKSKTYGKRKTGKFWDTLSNCWHEIKIWQKNSIFLSKLKNGQKGKKEMVKTGK